MSDVLAKPFAVEAIGQRGDEQRYEVTAEAIRRYAAATDDEPGRSRGADRAARLCHRPGVGDDRSSIALRRVGRGSPQGGALRAGHAPAPPIEVGMSLVSRATPVAFLGRTNGTSLVIRTETETPEGELVNAQFVTEFFRGVHADVSRGERLPVTVSTTTAMAGAADRGSLSDRGRPGDALRGGVRGLLRDSPGRHGRAGGRATRSDRPRPLHHGPHRASRPRGRRYRGPGRDRAARGALLGSASAGRHPHDPDLGARTATSSASRRSTPKDGS